MPDTINATYGQCVRKEWMLYCRIYDDFLVFLLAVFSIAWLACSACYSLIFTLVAFRVDLRTIKIILLFHMAT